MKRVKIKDLKKGDFFVLPSVKCVKESNVWIRSDYDRGSKTFSCYSFLNVCRERFMKADAIVLTDLYF